MIPTSLRVRNFMCYRNDVVIDLRGIRVACLSGDNGAGKSALLDCVTWSLWGKARSNSDRELIALNATDMEVTFGFLLDGLEYRVTRRRTRGGSGPLSLELQMLDGDRWRTLSEATARETQRAIDRLLRMDYDTFINSAFILQGRADEFTTKTPALRKQVLGDILNLSDYDRFEEIARLAFRERERELRDIDAELQTIDQRLTELPRHRDEVTRLSQELVDLVDRIHDASDRLAAMRERVQALEFTDSQRKHLRDEIEEIDRQIQDLTTARSAAQQRIERQRAMLARREEIEARHHELQTLRGRNEALSKALAERQHLLVRQRETERVIQQAVHAVESELRSVRDQINDRAALLKGRPALAKQIEQIQRQAASISLVKSDLETLRREKSELETQRGELQAENKRLKEDMHELKGRMDQIESAAAVCPICLRDLGPGERERIRDTYQTEGKVLGDRYRANGQQLRAIQDRLTATAGEIQEHEREIIRLDALCRQEATLQERWNATEQAAQVFEVLDARRLDLEARLQPGVLCLEERGQLAAIEQAVAAIPYDPEEHRAAQEKIASLNGIEAEVHQLIAATSALAGDLQQIEIIDGSLNRLNSDRELKAQREADLAEQVKQLDEWRAQQDVLQAELDGLERERGDRQERFGAAQQRLNDCLRLEDERVDLVQTRHRVVEEKALYDELVLAFGKRGIQAMIIENIVPELEEEANAILDKMPGNSMRVEFRTQRQAISGEGMIETLDIVIGDEAGRRPYELYSGGEAFRVNFAIRVALSTLLARRAGTRLQTLVIDEGFGTQDSRGRDGLIEAIRAIERDFQMILVITHIPELKELFPTRIDVVKTPDGSTVLVH